MALLICVAQNKPLLAPGRQAALNEGHRVVVGLARGQAYLPDLSVTGAACGGNFVLTARCFEGPLRAVWATQITRVHADAIRMLGLW